MGDDIKKSIENRPLVISIVTMVGMIVAIASGAFMLGQYQAEVEGRLVQTDMVVSRLERMIENEIRAQLADHSDKLEATSVSLARIEVYMLQLLEDR